MQLFMPATDGEQVKAEVKEINELLPDLDSKVWSLRCCSKLKDGISLMVENWFLCRLKMLWR